MNKTQRSSLVLLAVGMGVSGAACSSTPTRKTNEPATTATAMPKAPAPCVASQGWITSPNPPKEIGGGVNINDETNCQFHQFEWQWFLSLVSPSTQSPGNRVFETYPVWLGDSQQNQCAVEKSLTGQRAAEKAFFARDFKQQQDHDGPILPTEIAQATGGVLYDQAGNIVLYNVRYSPNMCQATSAGFQPNSVEVKTSWRVMSPTDPQLSSYYTMKANVAGFTNNPQTLGLVGFHLVTNTANHPEFVWATFEHKSNSPDCNGKSAAPASGWSFTSASAATCLTQKGGANDCQQYGFNKEEQASSDTKLTGTPDEVCRQFPQGTDPEPMTGGNNNDTNRANIDMLNAQLVGPSGFLTKLPDSDPMAVWKNYFLVGGLWTLNGQASNPATNQRGSLELANTTMETDFQTQGFNCFTCHNYDPSNPLAVSHIYSTLKPASTGASK